MFLVILAIIILSCLILLYFNIKGRKFDKQKYGITIMGQYYDIGSKIIEGLEAQEGRKLTRKEKADVIKILNTPSKSSDSAEQDNEILKMEQRSNDKQSVRFALDYISDLEYFYTEESRDFYGWEKAYKDLLLRQEQLKENIFTTKHIEIAYRLCRLAYQKDQCEHDISEYDISEIINWEYVSNRTEQALEHTLTEYENKWNETLDSYSRQAYKIRRIKYLIDNLNELKQKSFIIQIPNMIDKIESLQHKYNGMLN